MQNFAKKLKKGRRINLIHGMKSKKSHKYSLYEEAVQTPEQHCAMFALMYADLRGRSARVLREDFCGTFMISCEWVTQDSKNRALCLDIDREPLEYGRKHHLAKLSGEQKRRLQILKRNVVSITSPKADLIVVCNFSFWILKKRAALLEYFKKVRRSLAPRGLFILELAGGPGMIEKTVEQKTINEEAMGKFTYVWDQKSFNPITREGRYAIHFKFPDGTSMKNAFEYDWRVWTIPEVRDALTEAGFRQTHVYWEDSRKGVMPGEYARTEKASNDYSWIAYVVGGR